MRTRLAFAAGGGPRSAAGGGVSFWGKTIAYRLFYAKYDILGCLAFLKPALGAVAFFFFNKMLYGIFYDWGVKRGLGGERKGVKRRNLLLCFVSAARGGEAPPSLPAQFGTHVTPPDQWGRAVGLTMFNVR